MGPTGVELFGWRLGDTNFAADLLRLPPPYGDAELLQVLSALPEGQLAQEPLAKGPPQYLRADARRSDGVTVLASVERVPAAGTEAVLDLVVWACAELEGVVEITADGRITTASMGVCIIFGVHNPKPLTLKSASSLARTTRKPPLAFCRPRGARLPAPPPAPRHCPLPPASRHRLRLRSASFCCMERWNTPPVPRCAGRLPRCQILCALLERAQLPCWNPTGFWRPAAVRRPASAHRLLAVQAPPPFLHLRGSRRVRPQATASPS